MFARSDMRKKSSGKIKNSVIRFAVCFFIITAALFIILLTSGKDTIASNSKTTTRCYETVSIKSGDSLWSVAREHCPDEYSDIRDYVEDLKFVNNLEDEDIEAGNSLIVIVYR